MDLCNISDIKALLTRHGFHFSKAKGQNFLRPGLGSRAGIFMEK